MKRKNLLIAVGSTCSESWSCDGRFIYYNSGVKGLRRMWRPAWTSEGAAGPAKLWRPHKYRAAAQVPPTRSAIAMKIWCSGGCPISATSWRSSLENFRSSSCECPSGRTFRVAGRYGSILAKTYADDLFVGLPLNVARCFLEVKLLQFRDCI